jgi:hypothetical protein
MYKIENKEKVASTNYILVGNEDGRVSPVGILPLKPDGISLATSEGMRPDKADGMAPLPEPRALVKALGNPSEGIGQGKEADSSMEGDMLIPKILTVTMSL